MPMIVWWVIAIAIGILAGRIVVDEQTPVEQLTEPITNLFGNGIEVIGYGVAIALIIVAVGYAIKLIRKR